MLVFRTPRSPSSSPPSLKSPKQYSNTFETIVYVTWQHREIKDQVFNIFEVKPGHELKIKQGQDLYDVTARVLTSMRNELRECQPDVAKVHIPTPTNTTAVRAA